MFGGACGRADPQGNVRAIVTRPPKDTVRFTAPARASRCNAGPGLLLQGSTGGNGVAIWLRSPDSSASRPWPLLQRGDTVSPRGATVGVRFVVGDVAHGLSLDSGSVAVVGAASALTVMASGTGLEGAAGRVAVQATFAAVPVGPDTVPCRPRL